MQEDRVSVSQETLEKQVDILRDYLFEQKNKYMDVMRDKLTVKESIERHTIILDYINFLIRK